MSSFTAKTKYTQTLNLPERVVTMLRELAKLHPEESPHAITLRAIVAGLDLLLPAKKGKRHV